MDMPAALAALRSAWGKASPLSRRLLLGILLGGLVWLGLVLYVSPQRATRLQLEQETRELVTGAEAQRLQLESLRSAAATEEALQRSLAEIQRQVAETLSRVPESRALSTFLRDLTAPASGDGISFHSITPHPLENRGELLELPFTIELAGSYRSVTRYLARLEALPRLVTVQRVSLAAPPDGKTFELRTSVAAATYVLAQPQSASR